jgi:Holliday junction resolvase RusA-like endonuclease
MHLEYVVLGQPISNQATGKKGLANLNAWKAKVKAEAKKLWKAAPLKGRLKAIIINFHKGDKPPLDVDNMSKPIHDIMNNLVYDDDRQIRQAEISHVRIDAPMSFAGASKILVDAVQKAQQFVYIRIEDATDPFPLPK